MKHHYTQIIFICVILLLLPASQISTSVASLHTIRGYVYVNNQLVSDGVIVKVSFSTRDEIDTTSNTGHYQIDFQGHDEETGIFSIQYQGRWYTPDKNQIVFIESEQIAYLIDLSITVSPQEQPTVVYVDDDYTSQSIGWQYDHFNCIQDGINAVKNHGVVKVNAGTYAESCVITKPLSLQGEDLQSTEITGGRGSDLLTILDESVSLQGFTLSNGANGIVCRGSSAPVFTEIIVLNNAKNGIYLEQCTQVIIQRSTFQSNGANGILCGNSSHITINKNTFEHNQAHGIFLDDSTKVTVYQNNFKENLVNAQDNGVNQWNKPYPTAGNYWDDYTGYDAYHGLHQDIPGSDGIGDTPYELSNSLGTDWFPLMNPIETYNILEILPQSPVIVEETDFKVTIKTHGGSLVSEALVEFNMEEKTTDSKGVVYFTAPTVDGNTLYPIIAHKEGFIGASVNITISDAAEPTFRRMFLLGRIDNLTDEDNYYSFDTLKVLGVSFFPFGVFSASGVHIMIEPRYRGMLNPRFIIANCYASVEWHNLFTPAHPK